MEGSVLARIAAIVFVAIAITAALVERGRDEAGQAVRPAPLVAPEVDPLRAAHRRCQELGEAAASDPDCLAVWAETRDRFLGRDRTGGE
ncbi:MAG TPA: putative entry exclusion protein TrbK-alt [Amaricoccus sp.]|uniref:putative entry exclusion protein TrbK-alt n=1 Tax=Amaricoccus sp. TaxID=1872485 RepID=UPI002D1235AD|nr:putative entry exclusion protein TrbK-alt [Amaricoccus sp.]HMQ92675.1 putative entry exclusion protein TrbK-alt [Amaricoccus sp.]HMR52647.1 putative entry exclusion protein TrbK-alt [Amaricoccus sp.]HMU00121.1 putative entry exclusion protein TrbK-alt [Amaricoccus sp.]